MFLIELPLTVITALYFTQILLVSVTIYNTLPYTFNENSAYTTSFFVKTPPLLDTSWLTEKHICHIFHTITCEKLFFHTRVHSGHVPILALATKMHTKQRNHVHNFLKY